ncbi:MULTISPECIES: NADH-ubiquinone oxidoreductase-F iron-sulfur binding region domain-containing protein [Mycobacterium]|uniref:NADH dehydrogenase n=1 Tax=Mycobacterium kiyosense TaxID=2871094 RepID=A0AA37PZF0_9MYCO|nr:MULTISPECIES: NADH-ubiquinone oxidoreductase-F iron-sulfur binding region domain-containing protein [Mycobacterium]BDB44982.1 NADH dehydrogenase [Mycobacterium kiyosense]BDE16469.1 NADH dehydrogenase [Mycobacterium sp. 20KCMC460]GLB83352.1 NADH dehydrogenase [Mycobacterium kiyosense]GLB89684.1 NADH dehydrogenase [Mycobacterium kiyosense]GLB96829.1 NADH dehydrogenase [Mycobacterium kiyosense]
MTTTDSVLRTTAWPGCPPRLLGSGREDLAAYRERDGYRPLADAERLLAEVEAGGLLGRGGAAFPLAVKLRTVRTNGAKYGRPVAVANGEEGEPASIKDRWLLRNRPHLVLDGLRLAAALVAAERAYVFVSDAESARSVEAALSELDPTCLGGVSVDVVAVDPGYVAGEETAAVNAINGGPTKPTDKPPRPFEVGVGGRPTLVSNVETLAQLAYLQNHGAAEFRSQGTAQSPGTFLATITGAGRPAVLYELPHGVAFAELLALHGVSAEKVRGVLMGGYFAGLLDRRVLDATLDHETIRGLGSGLGCGAISVIVDECPVAVAASVLAYFDRENAGQCGSCFNGTAAMAAAAGALRDGVAAVEDLDRLRRWSLVLRGRGACGTLDAACNIAASLLDQFPDEVARHLHGTCPDCRDGAYRADRPYQVAG